MNDWFWEVIEKPNKLGKINQDDCTIVYRCHAYQRWFCGRMFRSIYPVDAIIHYAFLMHFVFCRALLRLSCVVCIVCLVLSVLIDITVSGSFGKRGDVANINESPLTVAFMQCFNVHYVHMTPWVVEQVTIPDTLEPSTPSYRWGELLALLDVCEHTHPSSDREPWGFLSCRTLFNALKKKLPSYGMHLFRVLKWSKTHHMHGGIMQADFSSFLCIRLLLRYIHMEWFDRGDRSFGRVLNYTSICYLVCLMQIVYSGIFQDRFVIKKSFKPNKGGCRQVVCFYKECSSHPLNKMDLFTQQTASVHIFWHAVWGTS